MTRLLLQILYMPARFQTDRRDPVYTSRRIMALFRMPLNLWALRHTSSRRVTSCGFRARPRTPPVVICGLDFKKGLDGLIMRLVAFSIGDGEGFQSLSHMAESLLACCLCYSRFIDELAHIEIAHIISAVAMFIGKYAPSAESAVVYATRGPRQAVGHNGCSSMK